MNLNKVLQKKLQALRRRPSVGSALFRSSSVATQESLAGGSMFAPWRETMNNYIFQNTREPRTCSGVSHRIHLCFGSSPRFPRLIDHPVLFDRGLFLGSTLGLPAVSSSLTNPK